MMIFLNRTEKETSLQKINNKKRANESEKREETKTIVKKNKK